MVNEVAQWMLLGVVGFLMLGLFRQVALTLPPDRRATMEGPSLGRQAPSELLRAVSEETEVDQKNGFTVAFVSEACVGCQRLLALLPSALREVGAIVLVAAHPSAGFVGELRKTSVPVIADDDTLWMACHVTATPLVLHVDGRGKITRKEVTHDVRHVAPATV